METDVDAATEILARSREELTQRARGAPRARAGAPPDVLTDRGLCAGARGARRSVALPGRVVAPERAAADADRGRGLLRRRRGARERREVRACDLGARRSSRSEDGPSSWSRSPTTASAGQIRSWARAPRPRGPRRVARRTLVVSPQAGDASARRSPDGASSATRAGIRREHHRWHREGRPLRAVGRLARVAADRPERPSPDSGGSTPPSAESRAAPTGTVTFLFADVEGSTRLVQTAGARLRGLHRRRPPASSARRSRHDRRGRGRRDGDELSAVFLEVPAPLAGGARRSRAAPRPRVAGWPRGHPNGAPHRRAALGRGRLHGSRRPSAPRGSRRRATAARSSSRRQRPRSSPRPRRAISGRTASPGLPDPERIHQLSPTACRATSRRSAARCRSSEMPSRVVLADDSVLLREGVARLLEEAGFEVVGPVGHGR